MADNRIPPVQDNDLKKVGLAGWGRLTAVLFRVLIILGLISLTIFIILLVFTKIFTIWILLIPVVLVLIGICLAWLEYYLHDRLNATRDKRINPVNKE